MVQAFSCQNMLPKHAPKTCSQNNVLPERAPKTCSQKRSQNVLPERAPKKVSMPLLFGETIMPVTLQNLRRSMD